MSIISERLRYARELKNLTQKQVYKDTGIHYKTLSGYERDVSEPDIETLKKLAEYYDVDVNYLLGVTNNINLKIDNVIGFFNENNKSIIDILESVVSESERMVLNDFKNLSPQSQKDLEEYIKLLKLRDMQRRNQSKNNAKASKE